LHHQIHGQPTFPSLCFQIAWFRNIFIFIQRRRGLRCIFFIFEYVLTILVVNIVFWMLN
jgi:hypothetical protein